MSQINQREEAEILFDLVRTRYGERLTEDQLAEVKEGVDRIAETVTSLRRVRLENWDEPFSVFIPFRKELDE